MPKYICAQCNDITEKRERPNVCEKCSCWNTFDIADEPSEIGIQFQSEPILLDEIKSTSHKRIVTKIAPLDDVTGGGFVKGAVYLLAGEPGIGKSSLLWQVCSSIDMKVMYASAEESAEQIKLNTDRMRVSGRHISLFNESNVDRIIQYAIKLKVKLLIVDSIQVIRTETCSSAIGSANQVRESGNALVAFAKTKGITTIVVGHITKDGDIAGPKTIEHMVDCPMKFTIADDNENVRILKCTKNRFGSTSVRGIFEMGPNGLIPYATGQFDKIKLVQS